jgi:type VI secretion system secreted protein Hcp
MKRLLFCIAFAAASALSQGSVAAVDIFGKFTGIDGESTNQFHPKWIDVEAYSWGASNPVIFGGGGISTGKVNFSDFSFTKLVDASSPALFFNMASGKRIDEALFDIVKVGGDPFTVLKYKFSDVFISSYSIGSGGDTPTENISFAFSKIEMTYFPQDASGKAGGAITAFWDVTKNTGGLNTAPIPEPSTWAMLVAGLVFVLFFGRNRVRSRGLAT